MTAGDPYSVLGITSSATDEEVRAAYRARSLLVHPDLHHERPEPVRREAGRAMSQLTDAYRAVMAERAGRAARSGSGPPGSSAPGSQAPGSPGGTSTFRRLGRLAARSRTARLAAEAGRRDGGVAYRLGWLVGRRRSG